MMRVHLELDFCPLCETVVCIPMRARFEHWRQTHSDVTELTIAQVSWILNRTEPQDVFEEIYPFDYRSPTGTRLWRMETVERYLGADLRRLW
jgi:hypothetical protein